MGGGVTQLVKPEHREMRLTQEVLNKRGQAGGGEQMPLLSTKHKILGPPLSPDTRSFLLLAKRMLLQAIPHQTGQGNFSRMFGWQKQRLGCAVSRCWARQAHQK